MHERCPLLSCHRCAALAVGSKEFAQPMQGGLSQCVAYRKFIVGGLKSCSCLTVVESKSNHP